MNNQVTILLADENKEMISKIKDNLEGSKEIKDIIITSGGEDTLNKLIEYNPDVAVVDVILSGIDGFEIIEECKKNFITTKFIVASSLSSDTFVQKAMNLGVEYYMLKPISSDLIL